MEWIERVALCITFSGLLWMMNLAEGRQAAIPMDSAITAPRELLNPVPTLPLAAPASPSPAPTAQPAKPVHQPQPPFPTFNSAPFNQQLQRYLRYLVESGPPDILIVGSSRAHQGVDPIALQTALASRGYPGLKIFNFGVNGATAQVVDLLLRQVLTPEQLPRLIVWADGSRAFNSGRIDLTYKGITASPGYKLISSGVRPPLPNVEPINPASLCWDHPSRYLANLTLNQKSSTADPLKTRQSRSFAQTWLCSQPLSLLVPPPSTAQPSPGSIQELQETVGFNPLSTRFNPATYFQRYPKVAGDFDGDYRDFTLEGQQTEALRRALKFAYAQQVPVVFVNLPLTATYLDPVRTLYEQEFLKFMQRFARYHQLTFCDFSHRGLSQNEYFTDPSHLNRYGAAAVSRLLANDLVHPLSRLQ